MEIEQKDWMRQLVFLSERSKLLFGKDLMEMQSMILTHMAAEEGIDSHDAMEKYMNDKLAVKADILAEAAICYANCQYEGEM